MCESEREREQKINTKLTENQLCIIIMMSKHTNFLRCTQIESMTIFAKTYFLSPSFRMIFYFVKTHQNAHSHFLVVHSVFKLLLLTNFVGARFITFRSSIIFGMLIFKHNAYTHYALT